MELLYISSHRVTTMEAALHWPLATEADKAEAAASSRSADIPTELGGPAGKSRDVILSSVE